MNVSNWGRIIIGVVVFLLVILILEQMVVDKGRYLPGFVGVGALGVTCLTVLGLYKIYVDRPK